MLNWLFGERQKSYKWNTQDMIDGKFPIVEGCANLNNSKNSHARRIMRLLIRGNYLSAMEYADKYSTTKLGARICDLRNEYGFNIQDIWCKSDSGVRYKKYYFNVNEVTN